MEQLIDGQLALQRLGGHLSDVVLEIRQESQQLQQRQAESDQRFEILLQEICYLI
ncbi:MAG: hypothetical protein NW237_05070 [Cyanobacteriota bacterium]|nr:hypothetical protein [Cyanobacteriota bacterium]